MAAFPNDAPVRLLFGYANAIAGRESEAWSVLDQLDVLSERSYIPPTYIALIFHALGEKDRAFEWLEKACEDRSILTVGPFSLVAAPAYDPLRSDPRISNLLRRVNLMDTRH